MYSPYIHVYPVCGYVRVYVCQNLYTYIIYIYIHTSSLHIRILKCAKHNIYSCIVDVHCHV